MCCIVSNPDLHNEICLNFTSGYSTCVNGKAIGPDAALNLILPDPQERSETVIYH